MINKYINLLRNTTLIGLSAITLIGCGDNRHTPNENGVSFYEKKEFKDWGYIQREDKLGENIHSRVELGDLDGDGDLDIVVSGRYSGIRIYENKIPQNLD